MVSKPPRRSSRKPPIAVPASGEQADMNGVTPARQARSEETFLSLINAGSDALEAGSLEAMTIGDIARAANVSVGAFYGRFENKDAFFTALQQIKIAKVWEHMQQMLKGLEDRDASAREFLEAIAHFWVQIFREHRGLYLAAVKHESTQPGAWTPFKRLGWSGSALIAQMLLPRLNKKVDALQVHLAMQFVNGLLVNATVNDPGPIELNDPDMEEHVARFLCLFLGVDRKPRATKSPDRNLYEGEL